MDDEETRETLRKLFGTELADHITDKQVVPQRKADALREAGENVDIEFVTTRPGAQGYTVTCFGCGRTAKAARPTPAGQVALCPTCLAKEDQ
jgi:hypothetical protein